MTCILLCLSYPLYGQTQQQGETKEKLTSALVLNFVRHITWPDESATNQFKLVYFGENDAQYANLTELNDFKVRGNSIVVSRSEQLDNLSGFDIVVVAEKHDEQIAAIKSRVSRQATLLVTINSNKRRYFGINIQQDAPNLSFVVNRYNLINQDIKFDTELFVLGGTDLDIAMLLNELENELATGKATLRALYNQVSERKQELEQTNQALRKALADNRETRTELESELNLLATTLNDKNDALASTETALSAAQNELNEAERELTAKQDEFNQTLTALSDLASEIEAKTQELAALQNQSSAQSQRLVQQDRVIDRQTALLVGLGFLIVFIAILSIYIMRSFRKENALNQALKRKNDPLKTLNKELKTTQTQLIEAEKLTALGNLVVGISHEINTPIGISITASSIVKDTIEACKRDFESNTLTKGKLSRFLDETQSSATLLLNSLARAADLIRSFKQISADQVYDERCRFSLNECLNDIIKNIEPLLDKQNAKAELSCPNDLFMDNYPGILSQIVSQLFFNAINHGFSQKEQGLIRIDVEAKKNSAFIHFYDNGQGIPPENIKKVFEPFFTTSRSTGSTGLGLHTSYNLALSVGGNLRCIPADTGAHFELVMPLVCDEKLV